MLVHGACLSLYMRIVNTVADGGCGIDVMCLMVGWKHRNHNRDVLLFESAAFALKHVGNKHVIAMLHSVGDLSWVQLALSCSWWQALSGP